MPRPSTSLATLRPDLAGGVEDFSLAMDRAGFIGQMVLPVVEVPVVSGVFGRIPLSELLKNRETRRAPGGAYGRGDWEFEDHSFATKEHGFEIPIDDREQAMYADYFDLEMASAEMARDTVMRNYEKRVAAKVFDAVNHTPTTIGNEWDDAVNATPINDVEAAVLRLYAATGLWANALIMNRLVFRNLRMCDQIINKVKAVMSVLPKDITVQHLQAAFDLEKIIVAGGSKNLSNEGQDASIAQIWSSEYVAVARVATGSNIKDPGLGRTFHYSQDGSRIGTVMETYRDESRRADIVRSRFDTDENILYPECLELLDNATTI